MIKDECADRLAIADVIARYHRAIDDGDSGATRALMADDAVIEVQEGGGAFKLEGADQIIAVQSQRNAEVVDIKAQHILGPLVIELNGDSASVQAYQTVYQFKADKLGAPINSAGTRNHYELIKGKDGWKVRRSNVAILWMTGAPVHA